MYFRTEQLLAFPSCKLLCKLWFYVYSVTRCIAQRNYILHYITLRGAKAVFYKAYIA